MLSRELKLTDLALREPCAIVDAILDTIWKNASLRKTCAQKYEVREWNTRGGGKRDIYIYIQIDESRGNEEPATLLDTIN